MKKSAALGKTQYYSGGNKGNYLKYVQTFPKVALSSLKGVTLINQCSIRATSYQLCENAKHFKFRNKKFEFLNK